MNKILAMIKDGMVVENRDRELAVVIDGIGYGKGLYMYLDDSVYDDNLEDINGDEKWDLMAIYTPKTDNQEIENIFSFFDRKNLIPIWKRKGKFSYTKSGDE